MPNIIYRGRKRNIIVDGVTIPVHKEVYVTPEQFWMIGNDMRDVVVVQSEYDYEPESTASLTSEQEGS